MHMAEMCVNVPIKLRHNVILKETKEDKMTLDHF